MKKIAILGSTGSVGRQTLEVIAQHPEHFEVSALAAGSNVDLIEEQMLRYKPKFVSVASKDAAERLNLIAPANTRVTYGMAGLVEAAAFPDVDIVVTAIVGSIGLEPTIAAIEARKTIALANKETLVTAGHIVMQKAKAYGVPIIPVDSEHSAIFQCLQGEMNREVDELILTASGGSFRHLTRAELAQVSVEDALRHPNWSMGAKITIDSATMMNKGFEVIEAHWLFDMPWDKIKVLLHEESIIHSLVRFQDQAVLAQLGTPDMKVPIQLALSYPQRLQLKSERLDLAQIGKLHFRELDFKRYPCIEYAYKAGETGGSMPAVLNAANEVAVACFLNKQISFMAIEKVIEETLTAHEQSENPTLEEILEIDQWARNEAERKCSQLGLRV